VLSKGIGTRTMTNYLLPAQEDSYYWCLCHIAIVIQSNSAQSSDRTIFCDFSGSPMEQSTVFNFHWWGKYRPKKEWSFFFRGHFLPNSTSGLNCFSDFSKFPETTPLRMWCTFEIEERWHCCLGSMSIAPKCCIFGWCDYN